MGFYVKEIVMITGCSAGGIGHSLALEFAARDCLVIATARSLASMSDLKSDPRFFLQELDVSSDESVRHTLSVVLEKFGRVDIVVNNAGMLCVGPLAEVPLSTIEQTFNTNVYGILNCYSLEIFLHFCDGFYLPDQIFLQELFVGSLRLIQAVVPHMAYRKKGTIVNLGSVSALAPLPWSGAYSASKAAIHALSDTLSCASTFSLSLFIYNLLSFFTAASCK